MPVNQSSKPLPPTESHHVIFRPAAIQRYEQNQYVQVLPHFAVPSIVPYIWGLLSLLMISLLLVWFAHIPVYVSGAAMVIEAPATLQTMDNNMLLVVFLPYPYHGRLQVGQPLFIESSKGTYLSGYIIALEPDILSPVQAQTEYQLTGNIATAITEPVAVAMSSWVSPMADLPSDALIGTRYDVVVEIGSQRIVSLLPLVGSFFDQAVYE